MEQWKSGLPKYTRTREISRPPVQSFPRVVCAAHGYFALSFMVPLKLDANSSLLRQSLKQLGLFFGFSVMAQVFRFNSNLERYV